jgi:hypothetical protein
VRHLYGTALAVVLTAVMFFAGAWGYHELLNSSGMPGPSSPLPAGGGSLLSNSSALLALAAVVATGLLAGLFVIVRRLSPLAVGLPGLLLLAWTGLYLVSVRRAVDLIPLRTQAFGAGWQALLCNGLLSAVGVVMVLPMCVPSRWRAHRHVDDVERSSSSVKDDEYLAAVKADVPPLSRRRRPEPELVGTVLPRNTGGIPRPAEDFFVPGDVTAPVDTTRITGASRVLRNTASFRAVPNPYAPQPQDPMPPDGR